MTKFIIKILSCCINGLVRWREKLQNQNGCGKITDTGDDLRTVIVSSAANSSTLTISADDFFGENCYRTDENETIVTADDKFTQTDNIITENNTDIVGISLEEQLLGIVDSSLPIFNFNGQKLLGKVVHVYDGDTGRAVVIWDNKLIKFTFRINGIDAAEIRQSKTAPNRDELKRKAIIARNYVIKTLTNCSFSQADFVLSASNPPKKILAEILSTNTKLLIFDCGIFDKYGRVIVNFPTLTKNMIDLGYALPYDGGTKIEWTITPDSNMLDGQNLAKPPRGFTLTEDGIVDETSEIIDSEFIIT